MQAQFSADIEIKAPGKQVDNQASQLQQYPPEQGAYSNINQIDWIYEYTSEIEVAVHKEKSARLCIQPTCRRLLYRFASASFLTFIIPAKLCVCA